MILKAGSTSETLVQSMKMLGVRPLLVTTFYTLEPVLKTSVFQYFATRNRYRLTAEGLSLRVTSTAVRRTRTEAVGISSLSLPLSLSRAVVAQY